MSTTTRLLTLLSLLQARPHWPGPVLAERLGVGARTVRRDVERLRDMGYSIRSTFGIDGGYRLEPGRDVPPFLFDEDQTVAIAVALQAAPALGAGIDEAAARALTTIRQVMPSRLRPRLGAMEIVVVREPSGAAADEAPADVLAAVGDAIRARQVLRFDYREYADPDEASRPPRRVEPHHLVAHRSRWYLVAWDLDRESWRVFRVDRITPRMPGGARFQPRGIPGGDVGAFVSARFKGSDVDEWPCRGTVVLDLPLRSVQPFLADGVARATDDAKRCVLEAGSWSWDALAASFARFGVAMEVVEPPELADAFAVLSRRCADAIAPARGRAQARGERAEAVRPPREPRGSRT